MILGEGTNIIPPDFFDGVIIKPNFNNIKIDETTYNGNTITNNLVNLVDNVIFTDTGDILGDYNNNENI